MLPKANTDSTTDSVANLDLLLEHQTRSCLALAGLTLTKAPWHLGRAGFQVLSGRQVLIGEGYTLSLAEIIHFAKRAGILL
jgi:hypothetical protein